MDVYSLSDVQGTFIIVRNPIWRFADPRGIDRGCRIDSRVRQAYSVEETLGSGGRVVMPGFVDPQTHATWAGDRAAKFVLASDITLNNRYETSGCWDSWL